MVTFGIYLWATMIPWLPVKQVWQIAYLFRQTTTWKGLSIDFSSAPHNPSSYLTHWGQVTHICVSRLTIIDSDNGLSLGWRLAIFWTNAGILLIGLLGTNFNEILIKVHIFSFKKIHFDMSSGKWRPFCFRLNVLTNWSLGNVTLFSLSICNFLALYSGWYMEQLLLNCPQLYANEPHWS